MYTRGILTALLLTGLAPASWASNGYFANGYGINSEGEAGIGIALLQDSMSIAANPAGLTQIGNRIDVGLELFTPSRSATISGNGAGLNGQYDGNARQDFVIPDLGYSQQLSPEWFAGVAVYGNGGMQTDYSRNPFAAIGGKGSAGVDLSQLFISPAVAWKFSDKQSVGLALNLAYQTFSAKGLDGFAGFSSSSSNLDSDQTDSSTGVGVRLGWTGQLTEQWTLGASWASRIRMSKFDQYSGLFADQGGFDIPENYGVGLSYRLSPALVLAGEYQRILYGEVDAVGDSVNSLFSGQQLGSNQGPGFGWRNINIYRIGVNYALNDDWTLRAGYSHSDQAVPASQTLFNILAPGVVQNHATLGASWKFSKQSEVSLAYVHGFKQTVNGVNSIPSALGGGEAGISLSENLLSVAWGLKF